MASSLGMRWHDYCLHRKLLMASAAGKASLTYAFVASSTSTNLATITVPVDAQSGDIAILFDTTALGPPAYPSGWTGVYQQDSVFETSVSYRVLDSDDAGSTVTGQTRVTYSVKIMLVFRPSTAIATATPSSLSSSGLTSAQPPQQSILVASPPAIVLGMTRAFQAEPFVDETFWDGEVAETYNNVYMKTYYEIQNDVATNRTITASADYGSYNIAMGFVINAA